MDADLFNYFAAEIMQRTDPQTQAFLTTSALLPVMDEASTVELTGNVGAKDLLQELVKRNYFIIRLVGSPVRYEFHPLFRGFLLAELERSNSAEALRVLAHKAGHILIEKGEYSSAIEFLCNAGALDEVEALVLVHAQWLVAQGQVQTLHQWLNVIPESRYDAQPWLHYWYGVSRMPFDLIQARDCFERAYNLFEDKDDTVGLYLSWVGIAESYSMMWDDFGGMEHWLDKYENLRADYPELPSPELEIRVLAALFSVLMYLRPHHPSFSKTLATLKSLVSTLEDQELKIRIVTNLGIFYQWNGDFQSAKHVNDILKGMLKNAQILPISRIYAYMGRCSIFWVLGETEAAREMGESALRVSEASGIYFLRALISSQLIYAHGVENDIDGMGRILEKLEKWLSVERGLDYAHYLYQLSWYSSIKGEHALAENQARRALELTRPMSTPVFIALCQIRLATSLIHLGEYNEAHLLLDVAQGYVIKIHSEYILLGIKIARAYAWLRQGNEAACEIELEYGFQLGLKHGYVLPQYTMDYRILVSLCEFSLARNIKADYARKLIRKYSLTPENTTDISDSWPWSVKIHALGAFGIEVIDRPESVLCKRQSRVFEMLKVLVSYGGRNVSEQQVSDLLWPNAEGDLAHQNFKVTLHRLRKLIGQQAVLINDGKLALNSDLVWVDVWAFERLLTQLESSSDSDLVVLVGEVVENYQGGLLPGDNADWVLYGRERLRERFLRITGQAAERLCDLDQWKAAIDCYHKVLETDPLAERFYIGLMRSHYELGQWSEGLVAYRRCCETLACELQIPPSPATEAWRERLRSSS
jgi:two-component SAPR family response regulator